MEVLNQVIPIYLVSLDCFSFTVFPIFHTHLLGKDSNACNPISNRNRMWQSGLSLENYLATNSGLFYTYNFIVIGNGVTAGNILFCHGISEVSLERIFLTIEYNNRTFYECFNNPFPDYAGIPSLNLTPICVYDRPYPDKISHYTPDLLPAAI